MKSARLALLGLITIAALTAPLAQAQDQASPNLTGSWQMNQAKSDDIAAIMRKTMGGGRGPGEVPGGNMGRRDQIGGGMDGGRGRGRGMNPGSQDDSPELGKDRDGQNSDEGMKRAEQIRQENAHLEIFQDGAELNITNGLDISQLLRTDGSPVTIWTERGEAQATALWEGPTLVVSFEMEKDRPRLVRRFHISEDGQTLTVTEERPLPGKEGKALLRLVYDRQS